MSRDVLSSHRRFQILNAVLLFMLGALLIVVFFSESGSMENIKEVRHSGANGQIVERCVSCHNAGAHKAVAGHDILLEACTPCHNGMGRGVTVETAHMADDEPASKIKGKRRESTKAEKYTPADPPSGFKGENPDALFKGDEVMVGCLRCHPPQKLPADSRAARGWNLFVSKGCGGCHMVSGMGSGTKGPDLTRIGDILSIQTLAQRIVAPQASGFFNVMPNFGFSDPEARSVALFLKGQSRLHLRPDDYRVETPEARDAVERLKCTGCHKFRGRDGGVGPDLDLLAYRRTRQWVRDFLFNMEAFRPSARMPDVADQPSVGSVLDELFRPPAKMMRPASSDGQYKWLCARCHGDAGDGKGINAMNLNSAPRPFQANQGYFLLASRERLVKSIATGIEGTSMPPSRGILTVDEVESLLDFVLYRFVGIGPAEPLEDLAVPPRKRADAPNGERAYLQDCVQCHGVSGDRGAGIVHQRYPQPRNFMNKPYMDSLTDEQIFRAIARGIPGTRMKAYRSAVPGSGVRTKASLSDDTIWQLVDHVRRLSRGGG